MSTPLALLLSAPGTYRGTGDGAESGPFLARITVAPVVGHRGVALDYEAITPDGRVLHVEHSVLTTGEDEHLELHVLCDELPGMTRFAEREPGVFATYQGGLQAKITVYAPEPGHLEYTWWWTRDDRPMREQLRAHVVRD